MAAGAHEAAWLKCTLHQSQTVLDTVPLFIRCAKVVPIWNDINRQTYSGWRLIEKSPPKVNVDTLTSNHLTCE